ncbi:MAG: hypothetical protein U5K79_17525 [Cyclobacteriaceae bacterium]|nr:hypothetical protein [Cyclobacteriaceae bacterium]
MEKYRQGISEEDLTFTKNSLIKSNARSMETLGEKMEVLRTMSKYNWDVSYLTKEEGITSNMMLEQHKALAEKYIDPDNMIYVVAGDANTQFEALKAAGFDEVFLLDSEGKPKDFTKSLKPAM